MKRALDEKSITSGYVNDYAKALHEAEIVVIATPVYGIKPVFDKISAIPGLSRKTVITDAGSTKKEVMRWSSEYKDLVFIGSHPIAGSEKKGVEYSSEDLFENSVCVLCEGSFSDAEHLQKLKGFWESLGARTEVLSDEEHDRILAFTSHLPHLTAYALAGSQKESFLKFASTGFKDATRLAGSDPGLWKDIFLSNAGSVLESVKFFRAELEALENAISSNNEEALTKKLIECKEVRDEFLRKNRSGSD